MFKLHSTISSFPVTSQHISHDFLHICTVNIQADGDHDVIQLILFSAVCPRIALLLGNLMIHLVKYFVEFEEGYRFHSDGAAEGHGLVFSCACRPFGEAIAVGIAGADEVEIILLHDPA